MQQFDQKAKHLIFRMLNAFIPNTKELRKCDCPFCENKTKDGRVPSMARVSGDLLND